MYGRILLAYDGSREARTALREGALLAREQGAAVFLLSVVAETPGMQIAEAAYPGALAHCGDAYVELFDEAMQRLRDFGLEPEGLVLAGEPAQAIAAYASEVAADLVVVGHRKHGLLARWWSGTTGTYLVDHLACSLLIARRAISDEAFLAEMHGARAG